mmetsp:Transcript_127342/g.220358  ORF Transcript_127342/g.220358 Transcript_127342/m.220358 type:complete len:392 (+) Transcript_127342:201-1376(+)
MYARIKLEELQLLLLLLLLEGTQLAELLLGHFEQFLELLVAQVLLSLGHVNVNWADPGRHLQLSICVNLWPEFPRQRFPLTACSCNGCLLRFSCCLCLCFFLSLDPGLFIQLFLSCCLLGLHLNFPFIFLPFLLLLLQPFLLFPSKAFGLDFLSPLRSPCLPLFLFLSPLSFLLLFPLFFLFLSLLSEQALFPCFLICKLQQCSIGSLFLLAGLLSLCSLLLCFGFPLCLCLGSYFGICFAAGLSFLLCKCGIILHLLQGLLVLPLSLFLLQLLCTDLFLNFSLTSSSLFSHPPRMFFLLSLFFCFNPSLLSLLYLSSLLDLNGVLTCHLIPLLPSFYLTSLLLLLLLLKAIELFLFAPTVLLQLLLCQLPLLFSEVSHPLIVLFPLPLFF